MALQKGGKEPQRARKGSQGEGKIETGAQKNGHGAERQGKRRKIKKGTEQRNTNKAKPLKSAGKEQVKSQKESAEGKKDWENPQFYHPPPV